MQFSDRARDVLALFAKLPHGQLLSLVPDLILLLGTSTAGVNGSSIQLETFEIGQIVKRRDGNSTWRTGPVTKLGPPVEAEGYTWDEVEADPAHVVTVAIRSHAITVTRCVHSVALPQVVVGCFKSYLLRSLAICYTYSWLIEWCQ